MLSKIFLYTVLIIFRQIPYEKSPDHFKATFGEDSKDISSEYYNQNQEIANLKTLPIEHNIQRRSLESDYSDLEHFSQGGTMNPTFGSNALINKPYENDEFDERMYSKTIQNY